ncbi:hypothetical protein AC623_15655 [Bacillus sp. FJAT-27231]|uniref:GerAB/ArcD/ProY family transporter n=1 Tax=Bacillus sp. FJAT-27231 TaxID=1679168 RepID=UPI0006713868|nr:GerAB/ArcD/ProY family transporter [Bacillus sp. FJAT-27231]KMY55181.1 hypothetical protein AC623_15655 [Bacillus sp. FJAT-27231]
MLPLPSEDKKVSPYLAFYIVHSMQLGVVVFSFARIIVKEAGHDAWISVLIAGAAIHLILWMTYQIVIKGNNDITVIHRELFGKWLGGLLTLLLAAYLMVIFVVIMRAYIEVIQVWMFPQLQTWYMGILLSILVYLYLMGGFRVIVGLCLLSFFFTIPLLLSLVFPLANAQFSYLLPVMEHSTIEILKGTKQMSIIFSGFEVILFCYPFIKQGQRSHKWAQFGTAFTTFVYLVSTMVPIVYFSQGQLEKTIWPTLTLWKIVDFPFLERFEYAGISIWLFVMLPNLCMYLWAATRALKQVFSIQQRKMVMPLLFLTVFASTLIENGIQIRQFNTFVDWVSFYVVFAYVPFVYFYQLISKKMRRSE